MDARSEVLHALGGEGSNAPAPLDRKMPVPAIALGGVEKFEARFTSLGGQIRELQTLPLDSMQGWIDADAKVVLERFPIAAPISSLRQISAADPDIWTADFGVTLADALIAETGSILIVSGNGRRRMASLAPKIHIVLARKDQVAGSLDQALADLGDRHAVIVSGPSRTADIEGILVRGVHGPGELWLVWIDPS